MGAPPDPRCTPGGSTYGRDILLKLVGAERRSSRAVLAPLRRERELEYLGARRRGAVELEGGPDPDGGRGGGSAGDRRRCFDGEDVPLYVEVELGIIEERLKKEILNDAEVERYDVLLEEDPPDLNARVNRRNRIEKLLAENTDRILMLRQIVPIGVQ